MFGRWSSVRSLLFAVAILVATLFAPAALAGNEYYYFDASPEAKANCGDFTPDDVDLDRWYDNGELHVELSFEVTEEQHRITECGGSHFEVELEISDFDALDNCSVDSSLQYVFNESIISNGGSAIALIEGAKITDGTPEGNRLPAGTDVWIRISCDDVWAGGYDEPSIRAWYTGSWWSPVDGSDENCVPTGHKDKYRNPVCRQIGLIAPLTGEGGEIFFPIPFLINE